MGIVEGYRAREVRIREICFIEKPGGGRGRYVAKRCSDPRVAYPEVNV